MSKTKIIFNKFNSQLHDLLFTALEIKLKWTNILIRLNSHNQVRPYESDDDHDLMLLHVIVASFLEVNNYGNF